MYVFNLQFTVYVNFTWVTYCILNKNNFVYVLWSVNQSISQFVSISQYDGTCNVLRSIALIQIKLSYLQFPLLTCFASLTLLCTIHPLIPQFKLLGDSSSLQQLLKLLSMVIMISLRITLLLITLIFWIHP